MKGIAIFAVVYLICGFGCYTHFNAVNPQQTPTAIKAEVLFWPAYVVGLALNHLDPRPAARQ